jgi:hypothetical protein
MAIPKVHYPVIFGDYDSRDLEQPMVDEGVQADVFDQLQKTLALYNELNNDVLGILAERTTVAKEAYEASLGGQADTGILQERAEYGKVYATRIAQEQGLPNAFEVGYPIKPFADRKMWTPEYLLRATVRDINNTTVDALIRDHNTMFRAVLAALFRKTNYTFKDDKVLGQGLGTLNVKRLLNADGIPGTFINEFNEEVVLGDVNLYKVSGSNVFTNNTFVIAHDALTQLGMDGDIVYFISKADESAVRLLSDFVASDDAVRVITDPKIVDPPAPEGTIVQPSYSLVRSPRAIGRIRSVDGKSGEVVVLPWMFAGYMLAMDRSGDKPVVIRESDLAQLRGFQLVSEESMTGAFDPSRLIVNKFFQRIFGAGVRNRANGCVVQITTNPTYTDPAIYTTGTNSF